MPEATAYISIKSIVTKQSKNDVLIIREAITRAPMESCPEAMCEGQKVRWKKMYRRAVRFVQDKACYGSVLVPHLEKALHTEETTAISDSRIRYVIFH